MHLFAVTSILVAAGGLCHALADSSLNADVNHWCGRWAGTPDPADVPDAGQLPRLDDTRRLFIEPALQRVPFSPVIGSEPKVQVPKLWGNNNFRVALLSYNDDQRLYATSKSRWEDFGKGLQGLMEKCVSQGTGGAFLIPPTPKLTQTTLVVYAYAVGSYFDYQMNIYMSTPYGLNPARIQDTFLATDGNFTTGALPPVDTL